MDTTMDDRQLAKKVKKENCNDSLRELISRHSPLCYSVYKKYSAAITSKGLDLQDVVADKDFVVYQAATSFNPRKKVKFSTWLHNRIRYQCLTVISKKNPHIFVSEDEIDSFVDKTAFIMPNSNNDNEAYVFNILAQLRDARVAKIFQLRYFTLKNKVYPWCKVASRLGISTQGAINLHNKGKNLLKAKLSSSHHFDKI